MSKADCIEKANIFFVISPDDGSGQQPPQDTEDVDGLPVQQGITPLDAKDLYFCPDSLVIRKGAGPCPLTGDPRNFKVKVNNQKRQPRNGPVVG